MATALAAGALLCFSAAPALGRSVTVVVLPEGATVHGLTAAGLSPGVMSAGIGSVPAGQTYLDISQGNRIDESLYDRPLPPLRSIGARVPGWGEIVQRAEGAPANIVPGLLASSVLSRGMRSVGGPATKSAALVAARRDGVVGRETGGTLTVVSAGLGVVAKLARSLPRDGLLIAFASPPPVKDRALPIGIAGPGFGGNLTSDSTRTDGYVLSTDVAPTILRLLGVPVPSQMDGEPIRSEGAVDPGAVEDLAERMSVIPDRRAPVVIASLIAWIAVAALAALVVPEARRAAPAWLALAFAYMPLTLLAGAALEPSGAVEGLLVGLGAAALAGLTLWLVRGWWPLAVACAITLTAYGIDVIAGSPLTRLSLLGPNPIFGVRFYGIGNELEALIAVMVPVGVGAGLSAYSGWGRAVSRRGAMAAFLSAAVIASIVFGAGRFGADVGAAIVLPVGAAVAAASLPKANLEAFAHPGTQNASNPGPGWRRRQVAAFIATPFVALVFLALIDLVSGGNAHLTRSVLDAGGAGNLADIAQRRLELSADDFAQAAGNPLFWIVMVGITVAATQWRRIDAWLRPAPAARAGLIGACAAVAVGVLVNDSGATFLTLGALALGAALAFAWAQDSPVIRRTPPMIRRTPRNPVAPGG
jgi:hypothetical protein